MLPGFLAAAVGFVRSKGRPVPTWVLYMPLVMMVCGVWALAPDFPQLAGLVGKRDALDVKMRWQRSPVANVCFLHGWLDSLETRPDGSVARAFLDPGEVWGCALLVIMLFGITLGYLASLARLGALPRPPHRERDQT